MDPWLLPFSLWLYGLSAVLADYNITYDDTDPSITYSAPEAWTRVKDDTSKDRYNQTTSRTTTVGAIATLNFSGATAIYFMSYGRVTGGEATISFDKSPLTVSLQSAENAQAQKIVYTKKSIDPNTTHTITVSNNRGISLEVDAFILTRPGDPPPGVSASPVLTETSQGPNVGVIVGATVAALITLLSFIGAFFWYRRRQRIRSKVFEPVPLATTTTTTTLSVATSPLQAFDTRTAATLERTIPTLSHTTSAEIQAKAEYRGNTMSSVLSGSGSSGLAYSSPRGRNIPPTTYSSPSHLTTVSTTTISPSPPHSPHPLLPPPSYAAAASDLQIHEEHHAPE